MMWLETAPATMWARWRAAFMMAAAAATSLLDLASAMPTTHVIYDAEADIRDLDVGDLSDMESDVTPMFLDELKKRNTKMPSLQDMKDPKEWAANAQTGIQMSFATLTQPKSEELGKQGTEQQASRWKTMLESGGVNAQVYAVDPGKILFTTNGPGLVGRVKEFVFGQEDIDWFEHNQQRFFPEGRNKPLMDHDERKQREVELGWRKPPKDEKSDKGKKKKKGGSKKSKT
mmetsp:Transcript_115181/g.287801  ORF Transcript_115181/g.287801 Transcript_115181/m.287801 type:complete len:230 (-) Transcript_115181:72-761(-)